MNPEKRRRREKRKARINRVYRSGGLERLIRLGEDKDLLTMDDVRMFGPMDSRFTKIYQKELNHD